MAATKPQIRSLFATPIALHFLPVAQDVNAAWKPLILEHAQNGGREQGWRSGPDFVDWGGEQVQTLFRVARDLADGLTTTRSGGRVNLEWKVSVAATVRQRGEHCEIAARAGSFWSGVYYVDDGYAKSDDAALGGECELADPRGALPDHVEYGFRIPGGQVAGQTELIRPQTGMIILHPSWLARGERRHEGDDRRITVEFDLTPP
jgi:hypothetical protein